LLTRVQGFSGALDVPEPAASLPSGVAAEVPADPEDGGVDDTEPDDPEEPGTEEPDPGVDDAGAPNAEVGGPDGSPLAVVALPVAGWVVVAAEAVDFGEDLLHAPATTSRTDNKISWTTRTGRFMISGCLFG